MVTDCVLIFVIYSTHSDDHPPILAPLIGGHRYGGLGAKDEVLAVILEICLQNMRRF